MATVYDYTVLVCVQWVSPSTLKRGSGTTEWLGKDAALWWTPGGKQVTVNTPEIVEFISYWKQNETRLMLHLNLDASLSTLPCSTPCTLCTYLSSV